MITQLCADTGIHADYAGLCIAAWRRFVPEHQIRMCAVLRFGDGDGACNKMVASRPDVFSVYNPIAGIHVSAQAKLARMWDAALCGTNTVTIDDIDLILTQREYHVKKISEYVRGRLMLVGQEVYAAIGKQVPGRAPMGKMTCEGDTLMDIINPLGISDYCGWVLSWRKKHRYVYDDVEHGEFSDEVFLCSRLEDYRHRDIVQGVNREYNVWRDTIDRAAWHLLNIEKLLAGKYIECHALKPYDENLVWVNMVHGRKCGWPRKTMGMLPVIRYIGYDEPMVRGI